MSTSTRIHLLRFAQLSASMHEFMHVHSAICPSGSACVTLCISSTSEPVIKSASRPVLKSSSQSAPDVEQRLKAITDMNQKAQASQPTCPAASKSARQPASQPANQPPDHWRPGKEGTVPSRKGRQQQADDVTCHYMCVHSMLCCKRPTCLQ